MPIEACALGTPRGKDERFTSSPMGLDPDSIDLFPDNLSGGINFRPSSRSFLSIPFLLSSGNGSQFTPLSPERAHVAVSKSREISFRSELERGSRGCSFQSVEENFEKSIDEAMFRDI